MSEKKGFSADPGFMLEPLEDRTLMASSWWGWTTSTARSAASHVSSYVRGVGSYFRDTTVRANGDRSIVSGIGGQSAHDHAVIDSAGNYRYLRVNGRVVVNNAGAGSQIATSVFLSGVRAIFLI